jgi:MOSC domain-containing protein YiiM
MGEKSRKQHEAEAGKVDFQLKKGISKSVLRKEGTDALVVRSEGKESAAGVYKQCSGGLFGSMRLEQDYNHFRSCGFSRQEGGFKAGTADRAVSISTVAAYDALRHSLPPSCLVQDGDLGENVIIDGPGYLAGSGGLSVGTQLCFGGRAKTNGGSGASVQTQIELTEYNKPCYRMKFLPWAAAARVKWTNCQEGKWWKDPACPLSRPGGRGWLARIQVDGTIATGDACEVPL